MPSPIDRSSRTRAWRLSLAIAGWLAIALPLSWNAFADSGPVTQASYVYIGVYDTDEPFVDYEGDGAVRRMGVRQPRPKDPFTLELEAVPAEVPIETSADGAAQSAIVRLEGRANRTGRDGFRFVGDLECDRPVVLQFVQMLRKGDPTGETFPELAFGAGRHGVRFEGRVVGWLER